MMSKTFARIIVPERCRKRHPRPERSALFHWTRTIFSATHVPALPHLDTVIQREGHNHDYQLLSSSFLLGSIGYSCCFIRCHGSVRLSLKLFVTIGKACGQNRCGYCALA